MCHCGTSKCRGFLGRAPDDDDLIQLDNCLEYPEDVRIPEKKVKKKRKKLIGFQDAVRYFFVFFNRSYICCYISCRKS